MRLKTDSTFMTEDRSDELAIPKGLEECLEMFNKEFDGHMRILAISLERQSLQVEEKIAERELLFRRDRRKLKEQLIKGSHKASVRQRSVKLKYREAENIGKSLSKYRLEEYIKKLKDKDESDEEDEEEVIDLNGSENKTKAVNAIYNEKKEEIRKAQAEFSRVINDCRNRMLSEKIIEKLHEKEAKTITNISEKFGGKLLP
eukprot:TRINITY_DN9124_c0_g4_i1.p1 TRINITY_DN9124_c0_g4~~TRINITY_DN9124_c0_g4_i1.p1  ORF type:complete len:202 (-),score=94.66 TRINITY_DN9124_c0_g4_i1:43-648(-)